MPMSMTYLLPLAQPRVAPATSTMLRARELLHLLFAPFSRQNRTPAANVASTAAKASSTLGACLPDIATPLFSRE